MIFNANYDTQVYINILSAVNSDVKQKYKQFKYILILTLFSFGNNVIQIKQQSHDKISDIQNNIIYHTEKIDTHVCISARLLIVKTKLLNASVKAAHMEDAAGVHPLPHLSVALRKLKRMLKILF